MEKQLDKGYQWVELGQTDGYQPCQCERCRALHPEPGERLWIVHRGLAEELKKRRPGKRVMMISYSATSKPPRTFKRFPDNVVMQMSSYTPDAFAQWAPYGVDKLWTAELRIPYTTLGVDPPPPGTLWTMNVGREEYPLGHGNGPAVYSLWSPNLETRTFHDPSTFGDVVFK